MVMTKGEQQPNMSLEEYDHFFNNRHPMDLTVEQLNQIVFMDGFIKLHSRKMLIMDSLISLDMVPPTRSTLRHDAAARASPPLSLDEVKQDIGALGWQECPFGSIISVSPSAAPAKAFRHHGGSRHSLCLRPPPPCLVMWSSRRLRSKRKRAAYSSLAPDSCPC